jgi:hypothetical protein
MKSELEYTDFTFIKIASLIKDTYVLIASLIKDTYVLIASLINRDAQFLNASLIDISKDTLHQRAIFYTRNDAGIV